MIMMYFSGKFAVHQYQTYLKSDLSIIAINIVDLLRFD